MSDKVTHAANVMTNTSYAASGTTVIIGGLTTSEVVQLAGLALALATFVINWVYRHKLYQLEKRRFDEQVHDKESK